MTQRTLLLTGAAGGMGRACARLMGATHDLVLTDSAAGPLETFADELRDQGYVVRAARAGDLGDSALVEALVADLGDTAPFTLLHMAGVSPTMADWRRIMEVNLIATVRLLDAVEAELRPGSVAILIGSQAGHMAPQVPEWQVLLDDPLAPGFIESLSPLMDSDAGLTGAPGTSYCLSKQAVIRLAERRAARWGRDGARILTLSPGLILTPMGHQEVAGSAGARESVRPVGRPGRPIDIALAAQFLASEQAGFITGTDLRIDGGSMARMRFGGN